MVKYKSCHSVTRQVIKKRDFSLNVITQGENHIAGGISLSNSLSPISRCLFCSGHFHSMWLISSSTNMSHNTHLVVQSM